MASSKWQLKSQSCCTVTVSSVPLTLAEKVVMGQQCTRLGSLSLFLSLSCCVSALATNGEFATKVKQKQQKEAATNADRDVDADEVLDEAAETDCWVAALLCCV